MTEGLRALPTIRATCAAVALLVRLRPTGATTMRVEQSCKKLRRDTPLLCRCAAMVSFSPVFMDSLRGNVRRALKSGRRRPENEKSPRLWGWRIARHNLRSILGIPRLDCEEVPVRL